MISYNNFIEEIEKRLNQDKFLFCCSDCHQFIFNSSQISILYSLNGNRSYCYCLSQIDPEIIIDENMQTGNNCILDKEIVTYDIKCKECHGVLGCKVIMTNLEKYFLCDKYLIRNDKVIQFKISKVVAVNYKFKGSSIDDNRSSQGLAKKIGEVRELIVELSQKIKCVNKGKDLIIDLEKIRKQCETLKKVYEYLLFKSK